MLKWSVCVIARHGRHCLQSLKIYVVIYLEILCNWCCKYIFGEGTKKTLATVNKLPFNFHFDGDTSKTAKYLQCLTPKRETDHKHNYVSKYIVTTPAKCTVNLVGVITGLRWYKMHEMDSFKINVYCLYNINCK
jgi:hypothetical protein